MQGVQLEGFPPAFGPETESANTLVRMESLMEPHGAGFIYLTLLCFGC